MESVFHQRFEEACRRLGEARALLIEASPESLERCAPLLAEAMAAVRALPAGACREADPRAAELQREVLHLRRLAQHAATFYLRAMGSAAPELGLYTPRGGAYAAPAVRHMVMEA